MIWLILIVLQIRLSWIIIYNILGGRSVFLSIYTEENTLQSISFFLVLVKHPANISDKMKFLVTFALLAFAVSAHASAIGLGYGGVGLINPLALSPIGPSGIVTGAGAAGPSGVVTGAGAAGPAGIVTGTGAVGPTGPNGIGYLGAPALGLGLAGPGPSGIVTGVGAAGPSGVVTGAGAAGPAGIVTGVGAVGPTGPNGIGYLGAPALGLGLARPGLGLGLIGH
ncbi:collagen alpha-2(I) chain-like isoform X1 [Diorhabda carinulata]|uniref:collagen alpha-2(I) chain-like isoform X1 n=2 Tax=Diorhabda carinulata TaxID=1163345 RepID=UPI0025A15C8C|nr:collagen alpha-2(I) chain-like isoform X1 [Diorhabda carinulata]